MLYLQPDSSSCVPTTFAYLAFKQCDIEYQSFLEKLLTSCTQKFNLTENGMTFKQLKEVVEGLGFVVEVSATKPRHKTYLAGVERLPLMEFTHSELFKQSLIDKSVEISDFEFVYPEGHSVAIFEEGEMARTFDSLIGTERTLPLSVILESLEQNPEFLTIISCPILG